MDLVIGETQALINDTLAVCAPEIAGENAGETGEASQGADGKTLFGGGKKSKKKEESLADEKARFARNQVLFFGAQNGNVQTMQRGLDGKAEVRVLSNWKTNEFHSPCGASLPLPREYQPS